MKLVYNVCVGVLQAGIYIYNLVDWYSSSICMTLGGCMELIAVGWFYGKSICMTLGSCMELIAVGWFYGKSICMTLGIFMELIAVEWFYNRYRVLCKKRYS